MIVTLGDLLLDVIVRLGQPLAEGADADAVTQLGPGGQAANVAAWVAELGGKARFVGKLADDEAGGIAVRALERCGVEVRGPTVSGRTGTVVSLVAADGSRTMASDRGVSPELAPEELSPDWLDGCTHLHLPGYSLLRSRIDQASLRAAGLAPQVSVDLSSWSAIRDFGPERFRERLESLRPAGAVPATIGVLDGALCVGLSEEELGRFGPDARKVGPRDLAAAIVQGAVGATTVGGTLAACRAVGIGFMGTGGLGGVHRGFPHPPDVSADLGELVRTEALIVSSGVKSILDVPATAELLETLGVPVLGYRTDDLPLFYAAHGSPPVSARVESAEEAARVARTHWRLGRHTSILLGRPAEDSLDDVEPLIEAALAEAHEQDITGQGVTPFVLACLHRESGGRTLAANRELIVANAGLAGEVAVAYAAL